MSAPQNPNYAKGKLTKVDNGISATEYMTFDNFGRLTRSRQITDGIVYGDDAHPITYTYNLSGALLQETYPSGRVVKNEFESDGDLARIYGNATVDAPERTYANSFSYTTDGKIESLRLGNLLWEKAKFNSRMQPTEIALGHGANSGDLWKLGYQYGELDSSGNVDASKNTGNIARQTVTFSGLAQPFVQSYRYDSLSRLTEAKEVSGTSATANWVQQFGYDRYGNRTSTSQNISGIANSTTPAVDGLTNRFVTSGTPFQYDKNGNIVVDQETRQFTFNGDNKQTEVRDANNNTVGTYLYDGEGRRVKKVTATETIVYVYSNGRQTAEYSTGATPPANPTTNYTATDMLGSPRVLTDSLGNVVSRRDFLPFGEELYADGTHRSAAGKYSQTGQDGVRQRFTGYEKDLETGLDFAEARMYANTYGRFTAVDPLLASGKSANPQTFNRYVYVLNNPLILTDPKGLQAGENVTFDLYVRAFAPWEWFGAGLWRGDNRSFSTNPGASSKIASITRVIGGNENDELAGDRSISQSVTIAAPPTTSEMYLGFNYSLSAASECYVRSPATSEVADQLNGDSAALAFDMYGNNDAFPDILLGGTENAVYGTRDSFLTADIDLHPRIGFEYGYNGTKLTEIRVTGGTVTGDGFPSAEVFVRDEHNNSVMLGTYSPPSGASPFTWLPFDNQRPMITIPKMTISVTDGAFSSVQAEGQTYSLDEWNQRMTRSQ